MKYILVEDSEGIQAFARVILGDAIQVTDYEVDVGNLSRVEGFAMVSNAGFYNVESRFILSSATSFLFTVRPFPFFARP